MNIVAAAIIAASIPSTTNLAEQVSIMWAAHTNRLAYVAESKAAVEERKAGKTAVERVKENAKKRKRRSVMPKSAGGVKK